MWYVVKNYTGINAEGAHVPWDPPSPPWDFPPPWDSPFVWCFLGEHVPRSPLWAAAR